MVTVGALTLSGYKWVSNAVYSSKVDSIVYGRSYSIPRRCNVGGRYSALGEYRGSRSMTGNMLTAYPAGDTASRGCIHTVVFTETL